MTVEEKAEEYAKPHTQPDEYWYPNCAVTDLRRKAFIAGYNMRYLESQWVSVEDRLPEFEIVVLVIAIYETAQTAYLEASTNHWVGIGNFRAPIVTHWQNLPQPPKND